MTAPRKVLRCAVYTRKSSEEGLDQDFNSLHAQREASEAYIKSQVGEGWSLLRTAYDDGGFSGGNMDRPGLTKLMADVDAKRIDVVVVYKVDRLTRSLADFAKIVERFDAAGASFVSVTQAFNTTTSMGRLTLNVLLSFAQFEREVTGERIRDKIAASKAKGLWMGGNVPLGYEPSGRTLAIVEAEAEQVRHIFRRYLALGSVHALRAELEAHGYRSKQRTTRRGRIIGGAPMDRGALFHLLSNRLYLGQITHKGEIHAGVHPAIVEADLFEAVQRKLARSKTRAGQRGGNAPASPLAGLIFDDAGNAMTHVGARKGPKTYRYFVSRASQDGRPADAGSLPRFPAPPLEALLEDRLGERLGSLQRIEVGRSRVVAWLDEPPTDARPGDRVEEQDGQVRLIIPARLVWRGGAKIAVGPAGQPAVDAKRVDLPLLRALVRAEAWRVQLASGEIDLTTLIDAEGVNRSYAQRLVRLTFLAPPLKRAILEGRTPAGFTLNRLLQGDIPLSWDDQLAEWPLHAGSDWTSSARQAVLPAWNT